MPHFPTTSFFRLARALTLAFIFSSVLATSFLFLFGTLGILGGYGGFALLVVLAAGIWIGGTAYFARVLYRDARKIAVADENDASN